MNRAVTGRRHSDLMSCPTMHACLAIAAALALLALTSCSTVRSAGRMGKESRPVSGFSTVDLSGSGDVTIDQTGNESLTIEADTNVLRYLTSDVSGGTLKLGVRSRTMLLSKAPIRYRLTVKSLTGVVVSGSGTVTIPKITTAEMTSTISGSGTITIAGSAERQHLDISGSGRYDAEELTSSEATARISGSGDAIVNVSRKLDVTISGSGTLTYAGSPQVTRDISGSGSLNQK
ncbi:head GIN domain-containing protein [Microlunatus sp. Gsoil 973]|uniref:head GIN domain-containing protein n=1 Tax=Microlunatus sp. Gsoil 973 TaxID=2672569 RepID=UPI0012B4ED48|nr:head GIN domain-containing protein [Microlunatus sp. Gsoil 973]QGN32240.1 DUF2807 domain-containing protein [Microlunatus sp. Gsoil 973]